MVTLFKICHEYGTSHNQMNSLLVVGDPEFLFPLGPSVQQWPWLVQDNQVAIPFHRNARFSCARTCSISSFHSFGVLSGGFTGHHFFLQVGLFQRQGTSVQEECTLFRKQEVTIHDSCLSDILLSHACTPLSAVHTELRDHSV